MGNFSIIQDKLEQFIKRYYTNELLKGLILFFTIGLLYFLFTLFIEYMLWLKPLARTILFWCFVAVELALFWKFLAVPLSRLFKLQKGIGYEDASRIIGNHFPEVSDKLLNIIQLKNSSKESELLLASIDQKSSELNPIPFKLAVNFKRNLKYLKYAAIPVMVVLVSYATGEIDWFSDSYKRVVNYKTAFEPPAPFQFFVINEELQALENKDFKILVSTVGDVVPPSAQIHFYGESYFLQQIAPGQFEYVFTQASKDIEFNLSANSVNSKSYTLEVIKVPTLVNFEMTLKYPSHTNKKDEVLKSTGNTVVPEGTTVAWDINTKSTDEVSIYTRDTIQFERKSDNLFHADISLFNDFDYSISTSNIKLKDYENLAYSIKVIKDEYPELNLKVEKDSIDNQTLYFFGQVSDDYGLSKLQLVYYSISNKEAKQIESIPISKTNFDEFVGAFPNQLNLTEGETYEFYFQVFDNDVIHNYKSVKSAIYSYRKLTKEEEQKKQLQEQNETIKDISKTVEKLKEQDKQLEELSKLQKEKSELNFNDKKKFENFLKRQKEQEQLMQNFNKKLKENIEEFQDDKEERDDFKEALKQRLEENEEQLKEDEKLLEELEKLQEKIQKEEFTQKLEELAKQNKNKQRSLEQLLELTKRYYVAKKTEKLKEELEKLSEDQEKLSNESEDKNTKEEQDKLNKEFEEFQKELDVLQKENEALKDPLNLPEDKLTEEEIKEDQQEASEQLQKKEENEEKGNKEQSKQNENKAKQKQKSAAKKMKQMSSSMEQAMNAGSGDQLAEDAEMLRQILDNLVLFSFDQEALMDVFRDIEINNNQFGKLLRKQSALREHFEHIDDSLFALSLRQPMISEQVNKQITNVFFNIDKSLEQLSENLLYQGVAAQQYTVTATNTLASFLSDVLDNMESQMNMMPGQGSGPQEMQLPDIIMSQEELNKQMSEGMDKGEKGKPKEGEGNKQEGGENGQTQGEGEGNNEEINGELYRIFQQQQQLRQALQDKLGENGERGIGKDVIKRMEEIELDLINKGFTSQTLQKMMDLQYQLLKLENATFMQGQDNKRQSETNLNNFKNTTNNQIPKAKEYFNTTEILNRQALPLQIIYKKKVQDYFKKADDQF
ncbi:hypothetical protein NA63_0797 [Flavobacteriaceae bacterium MAR_2010_105]|nr:hypothetical protein NA63_0797 [Flavobacteriaceae bacterium MAR_2010_105]